MFSRLLIAALWSPAGKMPTSWFSFVMLNYVFVTFPCGILGQVWYLILPIPDLCPLSYFDGWFLMRAVPTDCLFLSVKNYHISKGSDVQYNEH